MKPQLQLMSLKTGCQNLDAIEMCHKTTCVMFLLLCVHWLEKIFDQSAKT